MDLANVYAATSTGKNEVGFYYEDKFIYGHEDRTASNWFNINKVLFAADNKYYIYEFLVNVLKIVNVSKQAFELLHNRMKYEGKPCVIRIAKDGHLYYKECAIKETQIYNDFLIYKVNENQLQNGRADLQRRTEPESSGIRYRRVKAAITVGHLSYKTVTCKCKNCTRSS